MKQDETFRNEIKAEMESKTNEEGQKLDEKVYLKKDGKYTREAMTKYLFEKKTGKGHQFMAKEQQKGGDNSTEPSHWDKHKLKYIIGGAVLVVVVGLVWVFWDKLTGLGEEG